MITDLKKERKKRYHVRHYVRNSDNEMKRIISQQTSTYFVTCVGLIFTIYQIGKVIIIIYLN